MKSFILIIFESVRRDIILYFRYGTSRITILANIIMSVVNFFLMGLTFELIPAVAAEIGTTDVFVIIISGIIVVQYMSIALYSSSNRIANDIQNGTLEHLFSTPVSRKGYIIGAMISTAILVPISRNTPYFQIPSPVTHIRSVWAHLPIYKQSLLVPPGKVHRVETM